MNNLEDFIRTLHPSTKVLSYGIATIKEFDKTVDAVKTISVYNQEIVWGCFSVHKGKWKGKFSNNASTEGVDYEESCTV